MAQSRYLSGLDAEQRVRLEKKLLDRQTGRCFICDEPIDLMLHKGQLDIDHIDPLIEEGLDAENNFAITHASCNRSKGAANLEIARRLAEFERLQEQAQESGRRGANLGDVLARHGGGKALLRIRREATHVEFSVPESGDNGIRRVPIYRDKQSGMDSFFAALPLEYLHHDDRINPRSIGANIRGLIEEFLQKRPQLKWTPLSRQILRSRSLKGLLVDLLSLPGVFVLRLSFLRERMIGCGNVGISRSVRDFQVPVGTAFGFP